MLTAASRMLSGCPFPEYSCADSYRVRDSYQGHRKLNSLFDSLVQWGVTDLGMAGKVRRESCVAQPYRDNGMDAGEDVSKGCR